MISFIIASISKNYYILDAVVQSIVKDCPHKLEIIVVSPNDIKIPNITLIKDEKCDGSCSAFNLGAEHASGDYIAIGTDDALLIEDWWKCVDILKKNLTICSFRTGTIVSKIPKILQTDSKTPLEWDSFRMHLKIPHVFCITRSFYEGNIMKKHIFNPALFHMYPDMDLGYALTENGIIFPTIEQYYEPIDQKEDEKINQKNMFYRLDGKTFNRMWSDKYPPVGLFDFNPSSDEELDKIVEKQLEKNIFKEFN
jgi:glycosyltransferase involved in cell wall biosynthesis